MIAGIKQDRIIYSLPSQQPQKSVHLNKQNYPPMLSFVSTIVSSTINSIPKHLTTTRCEQNSFFSVSNQPMHKLQERRREKGSILFKGVEGWSNRLDSARIFLFCLALEKKRTNKSIIEGLTQILQFRYLTNQPIEFPGELVILGEETR